MAAAVQMAMQQLSDSLKDKPIYIVGYSNGATLAIHYALTALNRPDLPQPRRLVLLSPALAVTPLAALAVWQARLGHILGLRKLAWQAVLPEYDPYKYQSFAINAGDLSFRFTSEVQHLLVQHAEGDRTREFPPTLAFLSAVDATVSTRAVVDDFLMKLSPNHHELIVFDLNRSAGAEYLFQDDPSEEIERLLLHAALPFTYGVVRNRNSSAADVVLSINARDHAPVTNEELGMAWPRGVLSLSHVALPFPPEDPLYGGPDALQGFGLNLGNLALRGEKGAFKITAEDLLRQRWNPFYDLVEDRTIAFLLESE
jgi:pimeloyl-ACP methyl ester carboxylesterase